MDSWASPRGLLDGKAHSSRRATARGGRREARPSRGGREKGPHGAIEVVDVDLRAHGVRRVNREHGDAEVDDLHVVVRERASDRPTPGGAHLVSGHLPRDGLVVEELPDPRRVLGVRVEATPVHLEVHAVPEAGRVLRLPRVGPHRVNTRVDVRGDDTRPRESAPQHRVPKRVAFVEIEEASHEVDEVARVRARVVDVSDLFVVDEVSDRRDVGGRRVESRAERRVPGEPVVLTVDRHEPSVETDVSRLEGGHERELRRHEVVESDLVGRPQVVGDGLPHAASILGRHVAHERIELLRQNYLPIRALAKRGVHVGREVRNEEGGIAGLVPDGDPHGAAVLQVHPAHEREREVCPLVGLETAVVVRLEEGEALLFVERARLELEPGRVDVGADDVKALLELALADDDHGHGAVAVHVVVAPSGLEPRPVAERLETRGPHERHGLADEGELGLGLSHELLVGRGVALDAGAVFGAEPEPRRASLEAVIRGLRSRERACQQNWD